jgi:hypothetical protein
MYKAWAICAVTAAGVLIGSAYSVIERSGDPIATGQEANGRILIDTGPLRIVLERTAVCHDIGDIPRSVSADGHRMH